MSPEAFERERDLTLALIDQSYDKKAWHGPTLRGSVRGLPADLAARRVAPGRHSIAEQVLHAAYWKSIVTRRVVGGKRGSFPLKGANWFEVAGPLTDADWRGHLRVLDDAHSALREAVSAVPPGRLDEVIAGSPTRYTVRATFLGIASHDLYHAGQITLLKRLLGSE